MVDEKDFCSFSISGSEDNCSLTRAMKALVESFAATLLDAPALGGIMTVLSKSSSSAWTLSSSTSGSDPRSKSTGGLGGITLLAFGSLGGIRSDALSTTGLGTDSAK